MTRSEYEERRRALEEQRRADIALVQAAHEARLRSLERLWQAETEGDAPSAGPTQAVDRPPATEPARQPIPVTPAARPQPVRPRGQVLNDLWDILPQLPEVFTRAEVIQTLGYEPSRSSLSRAFVRLQEEGEIVIEGYSNGGYMTSYQKVKPDA